MLKRIKHRKNNRKIIKAFETLRKEFHIVEGYDKSKQEIHKDGIAFIELLYMEIANAFNHLGYLHLEDDREDLQLHRRYMEKGIYYAAKHKKHMAMAYLEGIYKDLDKLEHTSELWTELLEKAEDTINNIDDVYEELFTKGDK